MDAASLAEAFQVFARASDELTQAYSGLQGQVSVLTERLDLLLAALPAGVVVLDQQGKVEQVNRAAQDMLGDVTNVDWQGFAAGAFVATDTPGEWALAGKTEDARISISATAQTMTGGRIVLLHDEQKERIDRQQKDHPRPDHHRLAATISTPRTLSV